MRWRLHLLWPLLLLLCLPLLAFGQEFDFEIPEEEVAPKIEFSGNLDTKWGLLRTRQASPFFSLNFGSAPADSADLSQYRLDLYLDGEYLHKEAGFTLRTFTQVIPEERVDHALFELYGTLNPSLRLRIGMGKQRHNWGKGYAFNPVGYANTEKDPENPDLALAGKASIFASYNRSIVSDWLKNISLTGILVHPEADVNDRFADVGNIGLALKLYLLLWDIDLDVMAYRQEGEPQRVGLDFSTNLWSNLEVHGEASHAWDETRASFQGDTIRFALQDGLSYLLGGRYLSKMNTTFIVDYYHSSAGLSGDEFSDYLSHLSQVLAEEEPEQIKSAKALMSTTFASRTFMRDYLYIKVSQPEPFSWLYSSVSTFAIANLNDGSFTLSPQLSYKRFTNVEMLLWPTWLIGSHDSEYGSKQVRWRVEAWMRFHF